MERNINHLSINSSSHNQTHKNYNAEPFYNTIYSSNDDKNFNHCDFHPYNNFSLYYSKDDHHRDWQLRLPHTKHWLLYSHLHAG